MPALKEYSMKTTHFSWNPLQLSKYYYVNNIFDTFWTFQSVEIKFNANCLTRSKQESEKSPF